MRPYISVIIPVYNCEPFLRECLDSISRQKVDFEVILIDDGSTDSSLHICEEYARNDKRFVSIHIENQGPAHARNVGLSKAKGEWVTFVDSDDYIEEGYLEIPKHHPDSDLIYASFRNCYSDGRSKANQWGEEPEYIFDRDEIQKLRLQCFDIYSRKPYRKLGYTCGKFLKNDILSKHNIIFPDGLFYYEDASFTYIYFNHISNVSFVGREESRYCYLDNDSSISNISNEESINRKIKSLQYVDTNFFNQEYEDSFFRFYLDQFFFIFRNISSLNISVCAKWRLIKKIYELPPIKRMLKSQKMYYSAKYTNWAHPSQRKSLFLVKSRLLYLLA